MFLLAIDTSGKQGGFSLARCEANRCEILQSAFIAGGTFSAQLIPQIGEVLRRRHMRPADLGLLAAVSGPGSFTGLRVGLAAIKGLAEVLRLPIVSLSLLELMAIVSAQSGPVLAVLDAGRGECYGGEYELRSGEALAVGEFLIPQAEFLALIAANNFPIVACEPPLIDLLRERGFSPIQVLRPGSEAAALAGYRKLQRGATIEIEKLDANYLRRSDAEIFSKPGRGQGKPSDDNACEIIRPLKRADLALVVAIERSAPTAAHWDETEYRKIADNHGKPSLRRAFVAEKDGSIVGFVIAKVAGPEWEIENIAVHPAHRRRRVGESLLKQIIEEAKREQAQAIWLEVRSQNTVARNLYSKCGFFDADRRKAYYRTPQDDAILYKLDLSKTRRNS